MRLIEFLGIPEMENEILKNGPGGARKGAGRKPQGEVAMVTTAFVITREQATWIETVSHMTGANKSQVVRAMIDDASLARVKRALSGRD